MVLAGYVKSLSVLLISVVWLLIDDSNFRTSKASIIDNLSFFPYNAGVSGRSESKIGVSRWHV